ncbi:MAG TPA: hypothetical protein PLU43_09855, partial [Lachnospiraceae bacterium]|nr:hypothetical protein [Lachnospiraceae bacterium]
MENNLTERYIYAVTRRLPAKMKEDIAKEIRTLIEDMLEERCGIISPTEKDVRVVLTELGTPDELYQTYSGSGEKCLIGPPYYAQYLFVLKLVLLCTAFGLTVSLIVQLLTPNGAGPWYEILLQWFFTVFSGLGMGFAYVTLLFAFFYHKKIEFDTAFSLDDL